jgi:hypothetical protein
LSSAFRKVAKSFCASNTARVNWAKLRPTQLCDGRMNLALLRAPNRLQITDAGQQRIHGLQLAVAASARPAHRPAGAVGDAVDADEIDFRKALAATPAQQIARVGRSDLVVMHIGDLRATGQRQSWRSRHTRPDTVHRAACSCLSRWAGNGEQSGIE